MSIDVVTLALAKAYADELVANGGDPEKTEQIIRDKINEVLGSIGGGADWAVNDETAAGYIKNRTHYSIKSSFPLDGSYWPGPKGDEVEGTDYFLCHYIEELDLYLYAYKVSDIPFPTETMNKITSNNLIISMEGEKLPASEVFEDYEVQELIPEVLTMFIADDGTPLLINLTQQLDLSSVNPMLSGTALPGVYFVYGENDELSVSSVKVELEEVKQLDLKYIPEIAFGNIEAKDYGDWVQIFITKRDGSVQTITINDGPAGQPGADGYTPKRGTDYWTSSDIAQIKSYVDSAILGGSW